MPLSNGRDVGLLLARFQCRDEEGRSCAPLLGAVSSRPFKSLGDPWVDTTTPHGRLMLTVLGGIAAFERALILQRTNEGRARALADGAQFGRKPKLTAHQRRGGVEAARRWRDHARDRVVLQPGAHHDCAAQACRSPALSRAGVRAAGVTLCPSTAPRPLPRNRSKTRLNL